MVTRYKLQYHEVRNNNRLLTTIACNKKCSTYPPHPLGHHDIARVEFCEIANSRITGLVTNNTGVRQVHTL